MITFVTFKWRPRPGYRSKFEGWHVDVLRRMIARNYHAPHRFACITDDPLGIEEPDTEVWELWDDLASIPNPSGSRNPSCYRRLKLFAANAGSWIGDRVVCIDLDAVICGDITDMFAGDETFRIWSGTGGWNRYNGSLWMLKTGAHPEIWEDFDPEASPKQTRMAGCNGSDQGWFAYKFRDAAVFTSSDGVYSYRNEVARTGRLASNARIVFFHGRHDPWDKDMHSKHHWIREHYR